VIRQHDANTSWWGAPVGVLTDAAFFALPAPARDDACAPFAWVEFRCPLAHAPAAHELARAAFEWIDVQIEFKLAISRVASSASSEPLDAVFADEPSFSPDFASAASFGAERYLQLPGVDQPFLDRRFAAWATRLASDHPACAVEIRRDGARQGWFLSQPSGSSLQLTLAMLGHGSVITGFHLYQRALVAYASRGFRIGTAGFSVRNTAVLNIYAQLGARFLDPIGCWVRLGPTYDASKVSR
jgi:hypothetical protein